MGRESTDNRPVKTGWFQHGEVALTFPLSRYKCISILQVIHPLAPGQSQGGRDKDRIGCHPIS